MPAFILWCIKYREIFMCVMFLSLKGFGQGTFIPPLERTDGSSCVPEGDTVVYQCTVMDITMGGLSTLWRGSAFNCSNFGNTILLAHSQYGLSITESCSNFGNTILVRVLETMVILTQHSSL